jgi:hypothetical protein
MLIRQQLRFALVESLKRYIVNRDGRSISPGIFFTGTQRNSLEPGQEG